MIRQKSAGPPVRRPGATRISPHQEADPNSDSTGSNGRAEPAIAGGDQFEIHFDETLSRTERFERFHAANPAVYPLLVGLLREWARATDGRKIGMRMVWERLRWELLTSTAGPEEYKLNDHFTSFYARLIEYQEPDLAGLFELRRSPEADAWIADLKRRERVTA